MMNSKTLRFTPLLLVVALAWPGAALAQDDPDAAWRAGLQAFENGNPQACIDQMQTALRAGGEAYERWGWLHMMLGICFGQRNQRDQAISELQTAKELVAEDLEHFQVNHALAQVYISRGESGDYDRAVAAENEASQYATTAAQRGQVAKTLGQAYYFKEDWANAVRHLSQAAEARGTDVDVAQKLGRAHFEAGNVDQAMQWFEKTLQLDRDNNTAITNIGRIHLQNGNWTEAADYLGRAVSSDPQNMVLRSFLGRAYLGARNYDEAIRQLEQVTQSRGNDGSAWYNLGQAYQAAGQDGRAIAAYSNAVSNLAAGSDSLAECLYDLGFVYERAGEYADALRAFEDSAEMKSQAKTTDAIERVKERIRREKEGGADD